MEFGYLFAFVHISAIVGFWSQPGAIRSEFETGSRLLRTAGGALRTAGPCGQTGSYLKRLPMTFLVSYFHFPLFSLDLAALNSQGKWVLVGFFISWTANPTGRPNGGEDSIVPALLRFFSIMNSFIVLFCVFSLAMSE